MRSLPTVLAEVGAASSLGAMGLAILVTWLRTPGLLPTSTMELLIPLLMAVRAGAFFAVPAIRKMAPSLAVIYFGGDVFLVVASSAAYLGTKEIGYDRFAAAFFIDWLGSALVVLPLVAGYLMVRPAGREPRLGYMLPSAAGYFTFTTLVLAALEAGPGTGGLPGVASQVTAALRGNLGPLLEDSWVPAVAALLFASLTAFSVTASQDRGDGREVPRLALGTAGTLGALVWAFKFVPLGPVWITLGIPALAIVGGVWLVSLAS